jgi:hypothetical protein
MTFSCSGNGLRRRSRGIGQRRNGAVRASGSAQRFERRPELLGENRRVLPHGEVTTPVDLIEVDQFGKARRDQASWARKTSSGNTVMATGTKISAVF